MFCWVAIPRTLQERKPYVDAAWLSALENSYYSSFSTEGTTVHIADPFTIPTEASMGALLDFAQGVKRYKEATRFVSFYKTVISSDNYFGRWIYDRNQEAVSQQTSSDGKGNWTAPSIEMVGVTDAMIARAAKDKYNTVFDLLRFGATRGNLYWKGCWVTMSKSDPRVIARRNEFLNKEEKKEPPYVGIKAPTSAKSPLQRDLAKALKSK